MGRHKAAAARMTPEQALAILAYDIAEVIDRGEGDDYSPIIRPGLVQQDLILEHLPAFLRALGIAVDQPPTPAPAPASPPEEPEFVRHTCNPNNPGQPLPYGRKAPEGECRRCDQLRAGATRREAPPAIQATQRRRRHEEVEARRYREHDCAKAGCFRYENGPYVCTAFES